MKVIGLIMLASATAMLGCSSGGGPVSGTSSARGSKEFAEASFKANPAEYSEEFVKVVGGDDALDVYKQVVVPAYTVQFQESYQMKVDSNLAAKFLAKQKDAMFMTVSLDAAAHQALLQEISDTSHKRFIGKLKAAGVNVVEASKWASNKDWQEFEKDHLARGPASADGLYTVPATGTHRLTTYIGMGGMSTTREIETTLLTPSWYVGFGHEGGGKPNSIKEDFKGLEIEFTPEVQVGGNVGWYGKYYATSMALSSNLLSKETFAKGFTNLHDNRADKLAAEKGRAEGAAAMANVRMGASGGFTQGASANDYVVSSTASMTKAVDINPEQFKKIVLEQLDHAEDLVIARYKAEL